MTETQPVPTAGDDGSLEGVGAAIPSTVRRTRRRRRPSGAPPPLPRDLGRTGRGLLVALGALVIWMIFVFTSPWARRVTDRVDSFLLRQIARVRADWLTDVATALDRFWSDWLVTAAAAGVIVLLLVFRRWRHLITFVASVVVYALIGDLIYVALSRPRPYDVTTIGPWTGFSLPAFSVAVVTMLMIVIAYTLVVPGRPRRIAKAVAGAVVLSFAAARLYLAVDHPFDVVVGFALAVAIMVNAFRFFTPN